MTFGIGLNQTMIKIFLIYIISLLLKCIVNSVMDTLLLSDLVWILIYGGIGIQILSGPLKLFIINIWCKVRYINAVKQNPIINDLLEISSLSICVGILIISILGNTIISYLQKIESLIFKYGLDDLTEIENLRIEETNYVLHQSFSDLFYSLYDLMSTHLQFLLPYIASIILANYIIF